MIESGLLLSVFAALLAALLSACLTWMVRPALLRFALARPNARSSHHVPTPQGAGIAVIMATLVSSGLSIWASPQDLRIPVAVFGSSLFIAAVGFADDVRSIPVLPRLILQAIAIGAIVFTVPGDIRIVPACPLLIERSLVLLAGLWFVNLVNFMDGLDWMTVAETVPVTTAIVILGLNGALPVQVTIVAAALCGAMVGFSPFNRPVAKVFLGDVGSLPIGLLLGWCLLQLAYHQQFAAVLLLPLYYLSDATVTLLRRLARREPFWAAHRSHFYQRATDNGFTVMRVVGEVFVLNLGLAGLAILSIRAGSMIVSALLLLVGMAAVAAVLHRFSQARPSA
jgi:UDP-N-acetylmuramyl pentapeptide phosphotransferase/UDP-N-acetylglucosamine-1-phosphate transferase